MVDIDDDGYLDIIEINDQFGPINNPQFRPRGVNQIWYNQGTVYICFYIFILIDCLICFCFCFCSFFFFFYHI